MGNSLNDPRPAVPLTFADIDATIRTFAQKFGRPPTTEELSCLEYARRLLSKKLAAAATDGAGTGCEEIPPASDSDEASQAIDASG